MSQHVIERFRTRQVLAPEGCPEKSSVEKAETQGGDAHHRFGDIEIGAEFALFDAALENSMKGFELGGSHIDQGFSREATFAQALPPQKP